MMPARQLRPRRDLLGTGGTIDGPAIPSAHDAMGVTCWCDTAVVQVTADDVWNGRTRTCGRPECLPPNR